VTLTSAPDQPEQGLYRFLILVVELLSAQELHFREEVLQGGNGIADQAEVLKPFVLAVSIFCKIILFSRFHCFNAIGMYVNTKMGVFATSSEVLKQLVLDGFNFFRLLCQNHSL
jgi:hypothetical protein